MGASCPALPAAVRALPPIVQYAAAELHQALRSGRRERRGARLRCRDYAAAGQDGVQRQGPASHINALDVEAPEADGEPGRH